MAVEEQPCNHCSSYGDHPACPSCLQAVYCSRLCQQKHWSLSHSKECSGLAAETFGDAVLPLTIFERERSLQNCANKYQDLYEAAKTGLETLQGQVEELERLREEDGEEKEVLSSQLKEVSETLKRLHRSKAGLSSSLARTRKKFDEDKVEYVCQSTMTEVTINHHSSDKLTKLVKVEVPGVHLLKVYEAQGEYGSPKYSRIPTRKTAETADLQRKALQNRGHMCVELMAILAGRQEGKENTVILLGEVLRLHPEMLEEVVRSNPRLPKELFTLSPQEANKFMAGPNLTYRQCRLMANMMAKLRWGVRIFGSEAKRRESQASTIKLVATEKLEVMKLLLKKTGKSKFKLSLSNLT